ncbi:ABC transporter ATP-binding protein [Pusillimonas sp. CC-YST705]|uniref:ABC transporter ATP-binding protein n=1 Tax=Mesopusillimonas faecipullorum TaxID=2755040 RepID=A0ABS8CAV5_9BURK|nr:ABC transporter ATP-binding protein [Mesopusillimonas faecipullorum]MCB5363162.1 ABC transporter ATP-binding protein [Mesopusillimonas faecipullorum]
MLTLKDLRVVFNAGTPIQNVALDGLALHVPAGQFVTVIGSNGAGKSTLLNVISGEVTLDEGSIQIDGMEMAGLSAWRRAGHVARVFQDPLAGTCEDLSIEENLALADARGQRRGLGRAVRRERREEYREQLRLLDLGLEDRLEDPIGLLSGGQRQSVSLLMAALRPSRILLLDEHTAALDPRTADYVLALTRKLVKDKGLTTLMVTHSMRQALEIGDRLVMLHRGKVALDVAEPASKGLGVPDLLEMFQRVRAEAISDDALLLG